jgi:hypothetical protein
MQGMPATITDERYRIMGDMKEIFEAMKEDRIERREARRSINTRELKDMPPDKVTNYGTCWCYRDSYPRKADFYPGTGRWRCIKTGKTYRGGAKTFKKWMSKHDLSL